MVCSMAVPTLRRSQSKEAEATRESGEEMDLAPDLTGFVEQLFTELRRKRPQTLGTCTMLLKHFFSKSSISVNLILILFLFFGL